MSDVSSVSADAAQPGADASGLRQEQRVTQSQAPVADAPAAAPVVNPELEKAIKDRQAAKDKWRSERTRAEELQAQLDEINTKRAEEQGQYKELYMKEKNRREEIESNLVRSYVDNAVRSELLKAGCVSPEDALTLGSRGHLKWDQQSGEVHGVDTFLDELRTNKAYLFQSKPTPTVNPSLPGGTTVVNTGVEDTSKLSADEIKAQLRALAKSGG